MFYHKSKVVPDRFMVSSTAVAQSKNDSIKNKNKKEEEKCKLARGKAGHGRT